MSLERDSGGDWGLVSGTINLINDSESCLSKVEWQQETGTHQLPDSLSRSEAWATGYILYLLPLSSLSPTAHLFLCVCVCVWLYLVWVAACRLGCPTACGILVLWPGIKPASPALEGGFLTTGLPGKSQDLLVFISKPYIATELKPESRTVF